MQINFTSSATIPATERYTHFVQPSNAKTLCKKKLPHFWQYLQTKFSDQCCALKNVITARPHLSNHPALGIDEALQLKQLQNGFRYYVRHHDYPFPQRAYLQLVVRVGHLNETPQERGIAHLIEHITQTETTDFANGEIDAYLASKGVDWGRDNNAFTTADSTVYQLEIPLDDPELLEKAIHILSEVAYRATLSDSVIESERGVVVDELCQKRNAQQRLFQQLAPVLLEGTPYPVLYDKDFEINTVKTCPSDTVRQFYKRWYQPENMALIGVGDFDPARVGKLIEKYFSNIPSANLPPSTHEYITKAHSDTQFVCCSDPELQQSQLKLYYRLSPCKYSGKATYEGVKQSLIDSFIHNIFSRRLREIAHRDDPPFFSVGTENNHLIPGCPYFTVAAVAREGEIPQAYKQLLLEIKRVKEHGFTQSELESTKSAMLSALEHQMLEKNKTSTSSFIELYREHFLKNIAIPHPDKFAEVKRELLPQISLKDLNKALKQFSIDHHIVCTSTPASPSSSKVDDKILKQVLEETAKQLPSPYDYQIEGRTLLAQLPSAGKIASTKHHVKSNVTEYILENGLKVLVKPTTFTNDQITLYAYSMRGVRDCDPKDRPSAIFSEHFYDACGMGDFDLNTLQKVLNDKNVSFSSEVNTYTSTLTISGVKKDIETSFQMFHLMFTNPGYTQKAFDKALQIVGNNLRNRDNQPLNHLIDAIAATNTQDHPEFKPITADDLKNIDYETCKNIHQELYSNPADFTVSIVGNLDQTEIEKLMELYLASLPQKGPKRARLDYPPVPFPPGVIHREIAAGKESACVSVLTFPAFLSDDFENSRISNWCCELLNRRLINILRKQLGKTYTPSCVFQDTAIPKLSSGYPARTQIILSCDEHHVKEIEEALLSEIKSLQTEKINEQELSDFKKNAAKDRADRLQTNSWWLAMMATRTRWGQDLDNYDEYDRQLENITAADIQAHFQRLFKLDNYTMITLKKDQPSCKTPEK